MQIIFYFVECLFLAYTSKLPIENNSCYNSIYSNLRQRVAQCRSGRPKVSTVKRGRGVTRERELTLHNGVGRVAFVINENEI